MPDPASDVPSDGRRGAKTARWETERAVLASNLPANARLVLLTLCVIVDYQTMATPTKYAPSLASLAAMTGLGESTVKRALNQLESAGWVLRTRPSVADARSKGARTRYQVKIPSGPTVDLPTSEGGSGGPTAGPGDSPQRAQDGPTAGPNQPLPELGSGHLDDDDLSRARGQHHHHHVDSPPAVDADSPPVVAGPTPPDPHPPLPTTSTSPTGLTPGSKETAGPAPAAGPPVDLVQALIDAVREVTGRTIDRELAGKGVTMVLRSKDGTPRTVSDPVAYLRTAVEASPTRFLPSVVPPPAGSSGRCRQHGLRQPCDHCAGSAYGRPHHRESKQEQTRRILDEFAASAAKATDGGQRLDNTGVTVVDQNGQTAGTAPAEPLNGTWADEPAIPRWMGVSVIPDSSSDDGPCGHCDGHTRLYQRDDGRMARCPTCHPLRHERKSA